MNKKEFLKKSQEIISKFNAQKDTLSHLDNSYNINTPLGNLYFRIDPTPRIKSYTIFFRFTELDKFDLSLFKELLGKFYPTPSTYSKKWNIHLNNAEVCLWTLEDRLTELLTE